MTKQTTTQRADGVIPMCLTLDRDAYALLREHAPTQKGYGRFLSRLIYEHVARLEERQRVKEELRSV